MDERARTPQEQQELDQLVRDTKKPLPPIVPGTTSGGREHFLYWAQEVADTYRHARDSGMSEDEVQATYALDEQLYNIALSALDTGRPSRPDEDDRIEEL